MQRGNGIQGVPGRGIWGFREAWCGQAHSRGSLVWDEESGIVPSHSWLGFRVHLQGFEVNFVVFWFLIFFLFLWQLPQESWEPGRQTRVRARRGSPGSAGGFGLG